MLPSNLSDDERCLVAEIRRDVLGGVGERPAEMLDFLRLAADLRASRAVWARRRDADPTLPWWIEQCDGDVPPRWVLLEPEEYAGWAPVIDLPRTGPDGTPERFDGHQVVTRLTVAEWEGRGGVLPPEDPEDFIVRRDPVPGSPFPTAVVVRRSEWEAELRERVEEALEEVIERGGSSHLPGVAWAGAADRFVVGSATYEYHQAADLLVAQLVDHHRRRPRAA